MEYMPITSLGFVQCDVPVDIMDLTKKEINKMISLNFDNSIPYNKNLAGAIEHEYTLQDVVPELNRFFNLVIPEYWKLQGKPDRAKELYRITKTNNTSSDVWANLQKKYELNPIHAHGGVLSFVYWVNIPYDIKEEQNRPSSRGNTLTNPVFSFVFPSIDDKRSIDSYHIHVDKSYEGQMIIFPAWLHHEVTPFYTSDDYRISVAGNLTRVM